MVGPSAPATNAAPAVGLLRPERGAPGEARAVAVELVDDVLACRSRPGRSRSRRRCWSPGCPRRRSHRRNGCPRSPAAASASADRCRPASWHSQAMKAVAAEVALAEAKPLDLGAHRPVEHENPLARGFAKRLERALPARTQAASKNGIRGSNSSQNSKLFVTLRHNHINISLYQRQAGMLPHRSRRRFVAKARRHCSPLHARFQGGCPLYDGRSARGRGEPTDGTGCVAGPRCRLRASRWASLPEAVTSRQSTRSLNLWLTMPTDRASVPRSPIRRRCSSILAAALASSKSCRPSRWRRSATCRSPIRRASRCRSRRSPPIPRRSTITLRAATWSPSSRTAPRSSASAILARSPRSR